MEITPNCVMKKKDPIFETTLSFSKNSGVNTRSPIDLCFFLTWSSRCLELWKTMEFPRKHRNNNGICQYEKSWQISLMLVYAPTYGARVQWFRFSQRVLPESSNRHLTVFCFQSLSSVFCLLIFCLLPVIFCLLPWLSTINVNSKIEVPPPSRTRSTSGWMQNERIGCPDLAV